jgi:signal transduction histidine kinase
MGKKIAVGASFGALLDAVDEERSRVARRLHDKVAQNLAVMSMHLATIDNTVCEAKPIEEIRECSSLMEETIRDVRAISYSLDPPLVAELGFCASLKAFQRTFTAKGTGLTLELDPAAERSLNPEVHLAIFRIVRDAAEGLAATGLTAVKAAVKSTADGVAITVSGQCGPTRVDLSESLFWSVVQERAVRHRGKPRLATGEFITEIQIMLPHKQAPWAVAH